MSKIFFQRKFDFLTRKLNVFVEDRFFILRRGETIELELPEGNYKVEIKDNLFLKGEKMFHLQKGENLKIEIKPFIPTEISMITIGILITSLIFFFIGLISAYMFYFVIGVFCFTKFLILAIKKNKYILIKV